MFFCFPRFLGISSAFNAALEFGVQDEQKSPNVAVSICFLITAIK